MSNVTITKEDLAYAEDMGFDVCESCGVTFIPATGYVNDGHQCQGNGVQDKYAAPTR